MTNKYVQSVVPPALPQAIDDYTRQYQDQLNNVQRLFYTRWTQSYNSLIASETAEAPPGGTNLYFPYVVPTRYNNKIFAPNTATLVPFDNATSLISGYSVDVTSGITVSRSGVYTFQYNVQWANSGATIQDAWTWIRVNNVDIDFSGRQVTVLPAHGGVDGHAVSVGTVTLELAANNLIELYAAVDSANVYMKAYPAQVAPFPMPDIPAAVATIFYVSNV